MVKYTYKNWWEGEVVLKYDYIISNGMQPVLAEWDNFSNEDISLIKSKQKEIFNERVAILLEKYKATFNKELSSSLEPDEHIRMTISQIDDIFKGVLPPSEFIYTEYWKVLFSHKELREIQEYYNSSIIRGGEVDYNFINSPSMKFQKLDENNQVYAHALYLFRKWVEALKPENAMTRTEQGAPTFTNNFDKIKPTEIYRHFKAGLVDKGYLIEMELNEYLKAAFELKTIPENLFEFKDVPNKATIEAVFYTYYKNVAGKIHGKQIQYAALLGDYFVGYKTATVSSNFSKSVY